MRLILDIALKHPQTRERQTLVSVAGVATGVGFSIAMTSLMEGSQDDFIGKIITTTPHVVVKDEYRDPPVQPVTHYLIAGSIALGAAAFAGYLPARRASKTDPLDIIRGAA